MSATIESDLFSMYFAVPVRGKVEGAPVVTVDGKSFPVVESFLDELTDVGVSLCRRDTKIVYGCFETTVSSSAHHDEADEETVVSKRL